VTAADEQRLRGLVRALDHESFAERERASAELEELAEAALPVLKEAKSDPSSAERRRRAEALLEKLNAVPPGPTALRRLRAVAALEAMSTPEARQLLESLAKGLPEARFTKEARAALERK
jgi:HEAT repeat protein